MPDVETEWAALMRAANAGDARAYAAFLNAVAPVLRGLVRARGRALPTDQHEDIVQEVLLAIHAKRGTWDEDRPLRPWLFAIARHKVVDAFRAGGARVHLDVEDLAEVLAAPPEPDPTAAADVNQLLARLDPRSAEIVRSASLGDEEAASIGARLSMSEGAVRVALHRAMRRLATFTRGAP
jgi:RNA polymerase sigma-70 factor (ECF subfamily)